MLNEPEQKAVRYYIGDTEGDDPFWGDPKAYVVLNSLFYPGIRTEAARAAEGKRLNPAILDDPERLHKVLSGLLSACRKCALPEERRSFRVERWSDYQELRSEGACIGFTSTSTAGFLGAYADRIGIALMAFTLPAGTPCIPVAEVLPHYAKADEAEILLPPYLGLFIRERGVPEAYLGIMDAQGEPPIVYAEVTCCPMVMQPPASGGEISACPAGKRVYTALMDGIQPDPEDVAAYTAWKAAFVQSLW